MPLRDLLCVVEATENPSKSALVQAAALARGYGAHASVVVAAPMISMPYTVLQTQTISGLAAGENERLRARAAALAKEAEAALAGAGKGGAVALCNEVFPSVAAEVRRRALCADLTVLDRPGGAIEHAEALFEEVLFGAGRPALVVPPDRKPAEAFRRIVLAWDGSSHAARALAVALGQFEGLRDAAVVTVRGEKDVRSPGADIAAHIERHGIKARTVELKAGKGGVAGALDAHAAESGADLIVMGGFGRTRLREFLLGGVTRELSRSARTPLLLAH